jgi:hypothetical protein
MEADPDGFRVVRRHQRLDMAAILIGAIVLGAAALREKMSGRPF